MAAEAAPLLAREDGTGEGSRRGGATWAQTLGNVVVSIVGTGVLGLPYAFRTAGWLAVSLGVAAAGCATLYCMLLLVSTYPALQYCIIPPFASFSPLLFVLLFCPPIICLFLQHFFKLLQPAMHSFYTLHIQIGMSCS